MMGTRNRCLTLFPSTSLSRPALLSPVGSPREGCRASVARYFLRAQSSGGAASCVCRRVGGLCLRACACAADTNALKLGAHLVRLVYHMHGAFT